jgi:hypothetical protein
VERVLAARGGIRRGDGHWCFLAGRRAAADDPWVLDASTADRGKDLLPEPVLKRVRAGEYRFNVVPADATRFRENYSKPFWEASAANAGKYDLDPKTCGLKDKATGKVPESYFGYPFPDVKASDPDAGCRIAWNFTAAGYMGGGTGASFYLTGLDKNGAYRTIKTRLQVAAFVGRHGGPVPNPEHVAVKATSVALEPADVEGVSTLTVRYLDWEKPDDMWAFVPQVRRARRVNSRRAPSPSPAWTSSPTTSTATRARSRATSGSSSARARSWRRSSGSPTPCR